MGTISKGIFRRFFRQIREQTVHRSAASAVAQPLLGAWSTPQHQGAADGSLDDESLDPKTWCRFPIFSGGFGREKAEF